VPGWGWTGRTWTEIVEVDCRARKLSGEGTTDRGGWRKWIAND